MANLKYYPMIVARTGVQAESIVREAARAGHVYSGLTLDTICAAVRSEMAREGGIGIYLLTEGGLSWIGYPHRLTNGAITRVNSVRHALSYLNRAPKR